MVDPDFVQQDFQRRLREIPPQGMGLSVDVYSPDLFELVNKLRERGLQPGYLEVFKATTTALTTVRQAVPDIPLAYHGEGLWITQPDVQASPFFQQDVGEMVTQLNSIQSLWLNHECAMKQMAGYSFGTYVPPLYTPLSAEVVADKYRDGSAGDGSAGSSSGRDRAALSLGDAAAHLFCRRHDTDSPFFSARHSFGALRSRAGHRAPLDGLSLYRRLPTDIS